MYYLARTHLDPLDLDYLVVNPSIPSVEGWGQFLFATDAGFSESLAVKQQATCVHA